MDQAVSRAAPELISVIMPAYNAALHIAESLESVLAQTYPHWELLVVDDGSTDATRSIVQHYAARDPRVRYIYQENARQARARNNGIGQATGTYIAFLDSDDLWLPEKLAVQLAVLQTSSADLVFAEAYAFEEHFELGQPYRLLGAGTGLFAGPAGLAEFLLYNRIPTLTVLARRQALVQVGSFIESPLVPNAEDYHLWLKLLLAGYTLQGMPEVLAAYREHAASVSSTDRLGLRYVIEAKADLLAAYPAQRALLLPSIRRSILQYLPALSQRPDAELYVALHRYLHLLGRSWLDGLFNGLQKAGPRSLAIRLSYFVFNYL